jgi:hypothetical protein
VLFRIDFRLIVANRVHGSSRIAEHTRVISLSLKEVSMSITNYAARGQRHRDGMPSSGDMDDPFAPTQGRVPPHGVGAVFLGGLIARSSG